MRPWLVDLACCRCLRAGRDFLITSIGALTDDGYYAELVEAATAGGSQLMLASGAMLAVGETVIMMAPPVCPY